MKRVLRYLLCGSILLVVVGGLIAFLITLYRGFSAYIDYSFSVTPQPEMVSIRHYSHQTEIEIRATSGWYLQNAEVNPGSGVEDSIKAFVVYEGKKPRTETCIFPRLEPGLYNFYGSFNGHNGKGVAGRFSFDILDDDQAQRLDDNRPFAMISMFNRESGKQAWVSTLYIPTKYLPTTIRVVVDGSAFGYDFQDGIMKVSRTEGNSVKWTIKKGAHPDVHYPKYVTVSVSFYMEDVKETFLRENKVTWSIGEEVEIIEAR